MAGKCLVVALVALALVGGVVSCRGLAAALGGGPVGGEGDITPPPNPEGWSVWDYIAYYMVQIGFGVAGYFVARQARLGTVAMLAKKK